MVLKVGSYEPRRGNVTTLEWINAKPAADVEKSLGYGVGRLSAGYFLLLLVETLKPEDFEFDGITLRSGGRLGKPADTSAADALRPKVHDQIMAERGADGYRKLQESALREVAINGPRRIAKVVPVTDHDDDMAPSKQYPMGGGGLQWRLKNKKNFFVAMFVDKDGTATVPGFSVSFTKGIPHQIYDAKAKVVRYLQRAPAA